MDYTPEKGALADVLSLEPLPENEYERLEMLRAMAEGDKTVLTNCPECGASLETVDPEKHALYHWPAHVGASAMSDEALAREAALYRVAKAKPPRRAR